MTLAQEIAIARKGAEFAAALVETSNGVTTVEQAYAEVVAVMNKTLPVKADGSAFTDAELHAQAVAAEVPFQNVIDRDGDGA